VFAPLSNDGLKTRTTTRAKATAKISRFGCAFTPAFGRTVAASRRSLDAGLKPRSTSEARATAKAKNTGILHCVQDDDAFVGKRTIVLYGDFKCKIWAIKNGWNIEFCSSRFFDALSVG